jgi:hypothetical protein
MGLYLINCPACQTAHNWFSGNPDQRCQKCKEFPKTYFKCCSCGSEKLWDYTKAANQTCDNCSYTISMNVCPTVVPDILPVEIESEQKIKINEVPSLQWKVEEVLFTDLQLKTALEKVLFGMTEEGFTVHSVHTTFNSIIVIGNKV